MNFQPLEENKLGISEIEPKDVFLENGNRTFKKNKKWTFRKMEPFYCIEKIINRVQLKRPKGRWDSGDSRGGNSTDMKARRGRRCKGNARRGQSSVHEARGAGGLRGMPAWAVRVS